MNASLFEVTIGEDDFVARPSAKLFKRSQPPPQQIFPTSLVSAPLDGDRIYQHLLGSVWLKPASSLAM